MSKPKPARIFATWEFRFSRNVTRLFRKILNTDSKDFATLNLETELKKQYKRNNARVITHIHMLHNQKQKKHITLYINEMILPFMTKDNKRTLKIYNDNLTLTRLKKVNN